MFVITVSDIISFLVVAICVVWFVVEVVLLQLKKMGEKVYNKTLETHSKHEAQNEQTDFQWK